MLNIVEKKTVYNFFVQNNIYLKPIFCIKKKTDKKQNTKMYTILQYHIQFIKKKHITVEKNK